MRIPEAREELLALADKLDAAVTDLRTAGARIRELEAELYRRPATRRAPVKHRPLTDEERGAIMRYAQRNPDAHQQDIATLFHVNPGRVSEVLRGMRA